MRHPPFVYPRWLYSGVRQHCRAVHGVEDPGGIQADNGSTSTCYGSCAAIWPPLLTKAKPIAGPGVRASLLGTTKRADGKLEVTYGGRPLYYFVSDHKPGQTTGQGLNQSGAPWWVISATGKEIHRR